MSQLKQDEWPAENEPTTTETQTPTPAENERGHRGARDEATPRSPRADQESGGRRDGDELSNVTPEQQVD